jgi:hydrophobe/amphiphile efflux-3 (HAE3) family protein
MGKSALERYGEFASKEPEIVLSVAAILTILLAASALSINIETDFFKSLPQDLESIKNQNLLREVFSESDSLFVLVKLNTETATDNEIKDIRDPVLMQRMHELEESLRKNPDIEQIFGPPDMLIASFGQIPADPGMIISFFGEAQNLFGLDYSLTTLVIKVSGKVEDEKVVRITDRIEEDIRSIGFPGSLKLTVTGGPLVSKTIFDLIFEDLFNTISIAVILILITLVVAYRSPLRGIFSVIVLVFAVIWTGGTMQLLGIPLSIITVTVGSLVIGIGIDYTIHIMNRYNEEKLKRMDEEKKECKEEAGEYGACMRTCFICFGIAVDRVGRAIIGTAVTTIISFMALALSGIPFLADLGIALSLGIFYAMFLSLFVMPSLLSLNERVAYRAKERLR